MNDYFYSSTDSANTLLAFRQAGIQVKSIHDILDQGVYLMVAVNAPREDLTFSPKEIEKHAAALEEELKQFPNLKALLLMSNAAIKALNIIAKGRGSPRVIPAGSTYKIRSNKFYFNGIRAFPSYLQTGKNFLIEKAKQRMVAEDIRNAFKLIGD
ncbi:MAG: uracil-DNA glycosylase [Anaerolineales bacterium]